MLHENLFKHWNDNSVDYDIFLFILIKFLVLIILCGLKKIHQTNNNEDVEKLLNPKYYIYDNQDEILHLWKFKTGLEWVKLWLNI